MAENEYDFGMQHYEALKYHMEEAYIEKNMDTTNITNTPPIALFSRKYYNELNEINHDKIHDFCFIGSMSACVKRRKWVIDFAKKHFTDTSIFINTDVITGGTWESLGTFDHSYDTLGQYCPKKNNNNQSKQVQYRTVEENMYYFQTMCQSKYVLCPGGDSPWSFRFYEVLMCKSIPVVEYRHHVYRTKEESEIKYKYILCNEFSEGIDEIDFINENTTLFEKHHLL
jgi:hypothetical protein